MLFKRNLAWFWRQSKEALMIGFYNSIIRAFFILEKVIDYGRYANRKES